MMDDYEFHYPQELSEENVDEVRAALDGHGIYAIATGTHLNPRFGKGGLSSPDDDVRAEALAEGLRAADFAASVGAQLILWPGVEGYNYPFQTLYGDAWARFVDGVGEVATRCQERGIRLFLEHKNSEPAMKILMRNIGMTLHVIHKLRERGITSVQVNMDWQHLIMNGESLGEYAAMLAAEGLLGHQHANSGWGTFDDDNMVGATAFMETLELALELRRARYGENGERLGFDLYPYTEDAVAAVARSVKQWRFIWDVSGPDRRRRAPRGPVTQGRGSRLRARLRRARRRVTLARERLLERRAAVPQDRLAVRDEHPRDRQLEQREEGRPQPLDGRALGQPASGAEPHATVVGAEQHVPGHDRAVRRDPVDDLGAARRRDRLDAARQRIARPEGLRRRRPPRHGRLPARRREHARAVPRGDDVRASRVPEDRHENGHGLPDARHEGVEGVVRGQERVDQHEVVGTLVGDRADVLLPLRMVRRPVPEPRPQLVQVHGG